VRKGFPFHVPKLPSRVFIFSFLLAFVFFLASFASAQDPHPTVLASPVASPQPQDKETDPLKRPWTEKQRKENEKTLQAGSQQQLPKNGLMKTVAYSLRTKSAPAFKQLSNDRSAITSSKLSGSGVTHP